MPLPRHHCLVWSLCHCVFPDTVKERIVNINNYITFSLYSSVCRSLFEKHKLMFAFLVCAQILINDGRIDMVSKSLQSLNRIPSRAAQAQVYGPPCLTCWCGKEALFPGAGCKCDRLVGKPRAFLFIQISLPFPVPVCRAEALPVCCKGW